jgi:aryl-alcohol dehydrogenase-like predicted oxidoreductase
MDFVARADTGRVSRPASIQNAYSLLNRKFEFALAEIALREHVGLLAYAPIAAGVLTGKYLDGARPPGARNTLWPSNTRYFSNQAQSATRAYVQLAGELGLSPAVLAHAFVLSRPFLTASIVGATQIGHLDQAFAALDYTISDELTSRLETLHHQYLVPAP